MLCKTYFITSIIFSFLGVLMLALFHFLTISSNFFCKSSINLELPLCSYCIVSKTRIHNMNLCCHQQPRVTGFLKGKLGMDGKDSKRNNKPRQSSLIKAQSLMYGTGYIWENPKSHPFVSAEFCCLFHLD